MADSKFLAMAFLEHAKPWDYMVATGLCEPTATLSDRELTTLHSALRDMDEEHLALALVIAENFGPELFAEDAARLLGHPSLSVRVNAYRVLRAVPPHYLSNGVREAVANGLSACPEASAFADVLARG